MSTAHSAAAASRRPVKGVALMAALYFLVLAALTSIAVVFGTRFAARRTTGMRTDATLVAAGDVILNGAVAGWKGRDYARQPLGTTTVDHVSISPRIDGTLAVTRLDARLFSLVADVRSLPSGPAQRFNLLVRAPVDADHFVPALLSAVDVSIGEGVSLTVDSGGCADSSKTLVVAPTVRVDMDPSLGLDQRPPIGIDSSANDSSAYLQLADSWWSALVARADVRLAPDAHVAPAPVVAGGACVESATNWGDPASSTSICATRTPVVYAPGDLTIEGGAGQGVLLVDGRLVITGAFTYSGQIVVRRGLETRADAISISGAVRAWSATSESTYTRATRGDVVLAHGTSLRASRCDAAYGMQSWLQPRAVRARAWSELF